MTLRRFSALGLAAFMLHLNVVRADVACAAHEAPAPASVPAQHDMADAHGVHETDQSSGGTECETPAQTGCCQAVTSCSPAMGLGAETQIAELVPSHDTAGVRRFTRPLTHSTAPEPPPPRV